MKLVNNKFTPCQPLRIKTEKELLSAAAPHPAAKWVRNYGQPTIHISSFNHKTVLFSQNILLWLKELTQRFDGDYKIILFNKLLYCRYSEIE